MKMTFDKRNGTHLTNVDKAQLAAIMNLFGRFQKDKAITAGSVLGYNVNELIEAIKAAIMSSNNSEYVIYLNDLLRYMKAICLPPEERDKIINSLKE